MRPDKLGVDTPPSKMIPAKNTLSIVASIDAPGAPYPPDTKAKGWRFELDYERIEQSDTWVLAIPEMRPWLLMLWLTSWRQSPCGSLPAADELISARIGMDIRQFRAHRDILMRGWWLAIDGRMYHPVITEQVRGLLLVREKESQRKQAWRDKKNQGLTDQCPAGQPSDSRGIPPSVTAPEPEPEPEPIPIHSLPSVGNGAKPLAPTPRECPHSEILKLWAEKLPQARQPISWTGVRQASLKTRWREDPKRQRVEWWGRLFTFIAGSDFLMGRVNSSGRRPFELSLDWLLKSSNFLKVLEGAYHERAEDGTQ